ncbi:hypothetical protein NPIL_99281 [Nephila pilipes]|uniref:Uncharacterized protein n=1 Tax=Nephila pilipes TaxID=299642 RepID=A0A8X6R5K9_NEPPI|nr:hypothetical protein NPIL_99281 [Nephila pilipes]
MEEHSYDEPKRQEYQNYVIEFFGLKDNIANGIKKSLCPNQCGSNLDSQELDATSSNPYYAANPSPHITSIKIKASNKDGFKSPTKTVKQPRKDVNFTLQISNPFDALIQQPDENRDPLSKQQKTSDDKIPPVMIRLP